MNPPANVLPALLAALLWGGGDFSGGMGVKHAGGTLRAALRIVLLSHFTSFSFLLLTAWLRHDPFPHGAPLFWGIGAGVAGGLSLTAFYIALSRGAMGASAAISGLLAAAIPAAVSIASSGSPGMLRLLGFVIAGASIWIIAAGPNPENEPSGSAGNSTLWLAILSGAGFGIYFVALNFAGSSGLIWPMATARMGSLTTCTLLLLISSARLPSEPLRLPRLAIVWALSTGLLDTSGNLLFIAATRAGRLDIAAVLASLYPASTILLAAWTLRERPTRRQTVGMAIAAVAVVMITL